MSVNVLVMIDCETVEIIDCEAIKTEITLYFSRCIKIHLFYKKCINEKAVDRIRNIDNDTKHAILNHIPPPPPGGGQSG